MVIDYLFSFCNRHYRHFLLQRPILVLTLLFSIIAFFSYHIPSFHLDASADTLVLENDQSLKFYRAIKARYGSDDYLIITYTPNNPLFQTDTLKDIHTLKNKIKQLNTVDSVTSILDAPLLLSPPVTLEELTKEVRTLNSPNIDLDLAKKELLASPFYKDLLISKDGKTTAFLIQFKRDEQWHNLLKARDSLREKALQAPLSDSEGQALKNATDAFKTYHKSLLSHQQTTIETIRGFMAEYKNNATLYLGGVPMITADSINFIRSDLKIFGIGVFGFLILLLSIFFRKWYWVMLPLLTCIAVGTTLIGFLGLAGWPVTVVSSNFISLLLIITLSICVHLIVNFRELHRSKPDAPSHELIDGMLSHMVRPCFFMAITTMVAFSSLLVSGIRPIIDFGWMMTIGIAISFTYSFTLFPALLTFVKFTPPTPHKDITGHITRFFANLIQHRPKITLLSFAILAAGSVWGISQLTVENRFIDYYKESTEIYQGMQTIDTKLGGTTPMDVIINAPKDFLEDTQETSSHSNRNPSITQGYWFNGFMLEEVAAMHRYLDYLPSTGKVLSLHTSMDMLDDIDKEAVFDSFYLAVLYSKLPNSIKETLFNPYISDDGNQIRFSVRVFESDYNLNRNELLEKVEAHLQKEFGLDEDQVNITGMLVLYNNLLRSLFGSQIQTIGAVFFAIFCMFILAFRNIRMAAIAIIPNILSAAIVLGIMGLLSIPLDIMTITIAAIVIGIGVDDTVHYIHRFMREFKIDGHYWKSVLRSHDTIGRAMYYTTLTITLGFSILALSNFIPTIHFGLLTGLAMLMALFANFTLLPLLITLVKPLK